MNKMKVNADILHMTEMAILIAIILLMAFTPIGYIKTAGLEITLITIPVIVGAITLGPRDGAILGGVFGLTSFFQAASGMSAFGTMLMGISPLRCFVVCVPTRILMGLLTGLIWRLWKNKSLIAYSITGLAGALLNTLFFMSSLVALFWNTDLIQGLCTTLGTTNVFAFVIAFVGVNGLVEAICCFAVAAAVAKAVDSMIKST